MTMRTGCARLRRLWLAGVIALGLPLYALAQTQFVPFPGGKGHIVEGNWQSCRELDGRYGERVYDHIVNGVSQFEVHLGPRREFAIFRGVRDEHRAHSSSENLLKPFDVAMENNRAKQRWELPSLNLVFSVTLGGGSRTDCESWYVLLEQVEKTSQEIGPARFHRLPPPEDQVLR